MGNTRTVLNNPIAQNGNGRQPANIYTEIGTPGLESWSGYIQQAYNADLYWPDCFPLFNRLRRSDPEIGGIVRPAYVTLARQVSLDWELPEEPSDDDKRAQEYGRQVLDDLDGGSDKFIEEMVSYVPFMGWGWWEVVPGKRDTKWKPPGDDDWRSTYNDGLPTVRRIAFRDHASFESWELDDRNSRLLGMWQNDAPNPRVLMPKNRSLHLTFGDPNNPEGLSPLEAVWRLERYKYNLELVAGIGFEHTAGYLKFTAEEVLTPEDKTNIAKMAKGVMSAQESNYLALPNKIMADIIDTPFAAAMPLLEFIRYYGMLKLQVYNMQFVAMSTTSGAGSYSAHSDSTEMGIMSFNGMLKGAAKQADEQLGRMLFEHPQVKAAFPGMTRRPKLTIPPIEKVIPLTELSSFVQSISPIVPLDDDDIIAIRRKSGFLPEGLPDKSVTVTKPEETAAMSLAELATPPNTDTANKITDTLNEEIREIYLEWLDEAESKLEGDDSEESIIALMLVLMGRVRRRVELRTAELADEYDIGGAALNALNRTMQNTINHFERVTLGNIEAAINEALQTGDPISTKAAGMAATVAMVGSGLWAAYQASKQAEAATNTQVQLEARWAGPDDKVTCEPCSIQVSLGWRPAGSVPTPGPDVCLGLTNCRHDIEYRNPETGDTSFMPEDLL